MHSVGQTIGLCRLLGWAFGPRYVMKNRAGTLSGGPDLVGQLGKLRPIGNRPVTAAVTNRGARWQPVGNLPHSEGARRCVAQ